MQIMSLIMKLVIDSFHSKVHLNDLKLHLLYLAFFSVHHLNEFDRRRGCAVEESRPNFIRSRKLAQPIVKCELKTFSLFVTKILKFHAQIKRKLFI